MFRYLMMFRTGRVVLGLLGLLSLSGCSALSALNAVTSGDEVAQRVSHAHGSQNRQQVDVYQPVTPRAGAPVLVFVYGGAWRSGARGDYAFVGKTLAAHGYYVAVPDYRLYPDVQFPGFVNDVEDAVSALVADPTLTQGQIEHGYVLMGHSSGAHTVALLSSDTERLGGEQGDVRAALRGLIAISGPYDLPLDNAEVAPVFPTRAVRASSANPIQSVSNHHPPSLLLHGSDDQRVLPFHSERYATALEAAGVDVEHHAMPGVGHAAAVISLAPLLTRLSPVRALALEWLQRFDS